MKKPLLRVALFGAGGFAANHVRHIELLQDEGLVSFVAVADPTVERLADVKVRLEGRGVRWFLDYQTLVEQLHGHLDAVVIATPIPLHLPMLEAALDHNLAVYMEKPPVPLIQDYLRVLRRPESRRVAVAFNMVASPDLWRLKQAMRSGELGVVRRLSGTACWPRRDTYYKRAGWAGRVLWKGLPVLDGPATNALSHIVQNLMFLAGETEAGFAVPETVRAELYRARPIETYDLCAFAGRWASGLEFTAAFSHSVKEHRDWAVVVEGEAGRACLGLENLTFEPRGAQPVQKTSAVNTFAASWRNFYDFATGRISKPFSSLEDCRGYVATTNGMFRSAGGIHDLPASVVRRVEEDGDGLFDVPGIPTLTDQVLETGRLFSELNVPWAVPGETVNITELRELAIEGLADPATAATRPGPERDLQNG